MVTEITWKDVPNDLLRQTEGHGYGAECECDLTGGDPDCTIQPPYEPLEDYIMRLIMRVMKAETALELAMCDLMNMDLSRYQVKDAMLARAKGKTP